MLSNSISYLLTRLRESLARGREVCAPELAKGEGPSEDAAERFLRTSTGGAEILQSETLNQ